MHRGASRTRDAVRLLSTSGMIRAERVRRTRTRAGGGAAAPLGNEERASGLPRANAGHPGGPGPGQGSVRTHRLGPCYPVSITPCGDGRAR
jgi:hypothetical protein